MTPFREELRLMIGRKRQDCGSNTPDGILADFLCACLTAFDLGVNAREAHYGGSSRENSHPGWRGRFPTEDMDWKNQEGYEDAVKGTGSN